MSDIEEEGGGGDIPEWVVTFGDMMSLLLTFFIMLVSLSEIKEKEKYQALVESVQRQFGYENSTASVMPGPSKPRNSPKQKLATEVRAKKKNTEQGGDKVESATGDHSRVVIIREGMRTADGTVIHFSFGSDQLSDAHRQALRTIGQKFLGKPQKIEIRGHTWKHPREGLGPDGDDFLSLAHQRAITTMSFLVNEMKIAPERIRISNAGPYEPVHIGTDPVKMNRNPRVEIFMLDEVAGDRIGTEQERQQQVRKFES